MLRNALMYSALFLSLSMFLTSCSDDDDATPETVTIDSSQPNGSFTAARMGDFTAESGTSTAGTASLGTDSDGANFLSFSSDFTTNLATGTVSIYLSTSAVFTADPANGNPDLQLIGAVQGEGEQYFKLDEAVDAKFTHVILWCNTAGVPFGNALME